MRYTFRASCLSIKPGSSWRAWWKCYFQIKTDVASPSFHDDNGLWITSDEFFTHSWEVSKIPAVNGSHFVVPYTMDELTLSEIVLGMVLDVACTFYEPKSCSFSGLRVAALK